MASSKQPVTARESIGGGGPNYQSTKVLAESHSLGSASKLIVSSYQKIGGSTARDKTPLPHYGSHGTIPIPETTNSGASSKQLATVATQQRRELRSRGVYESSVNADRDWFLKSPNRQNFIDSSYKVLPTLNLNQRVKRLETITKENQKLFGRL